MNKQKLTIVIILFLVVLFFIIVKNKNNNNGSLVNPGLLVTPSPAVSSYNSPKEIKYDSSTDLKKELESINPQVSEGDFE